MTMEHKVRVFKIAEDGKEIEVFMQTMPEENLRAVVSAANQKPRKPRAPAAKQGAK
jgi:hypothetical protein